MTLLIPASAVANAGRERILEAKAARTHALEHIDRELKRLDPYLSLVRAHPLSDDPGLKPGYWHVRRQNPIGLDTYMVIEDENGDYMEPHGRIVDNLRRADLSNPEVFKRLTSAQDREQAATDARKLEQREEAREELAQRVKAYSSPSVLFSDDISWRYRKQSSYRRQKENTG